MTNCTSCPWPRVALCDEATCVSYSSLRAVVTALAFAGVLHSSLWWRRVSCSHDPDRILVVPNHGMTLLYVLVHILGAIAMLLIGLSALWIRSVESAGRYHKTTETWLLCVASRWCCAIALDICCIGRHREKVDADNDRS